MQPVIILEADNIENNLQALKELKVTLPQAGGVIASEMLKPIAKWMKQLLNLGFYHDHNPSLRSQIMVTMTGNGGFITAPSEAIAVDQGSKRHIIKKRHGRSLVFDWKRLVRDPKGRFAAEDLGKATFQQVDHPGTMKNRATKNFVSNSVDLAFANDFDRIRDKELSEVT